MRKGKEAKEDRPLEAKEDQTPWAIAAAHLAAQTRLKEVLLKEQHLADQAKTLLKEVLLKEHVKIANELPKIEPRLDTLTPVSIDTY
jgi:hypothetical protein